VELGIELFASRAIYIADYHQISLALTVNGKLIEESLSLDSFNFFGVILGGKRVAATGRKILYSYKDLVEIFEAKPARPFRLLYLDPEDEIKLAIDTNLYLDPGLMAQDLIMRLLTENKSLEIPLNRPDVKMDWPRRGFFVVDLSEYVKAMYAERACVL
jgi:hypothetical protein